MSAPSFSPNIFLVPLAEVHIGVRINEFHHTADVSTLTRPDQGRAAAMILQVHGILHILVNLRIAYALLILDTLSKATQKMVEH